MGAAAAVEVGAAVDAGVEAGAGVVDVLEVPLEQAPIAAAAASNRAGRAKELWLIPCDV